MNKKLENAKMPENALRIQEFLLEQPKTMTFEEKINELVQLKLE